MNRSELYEHLAQNKRLLEMAMDRFAALTEGVEHPRIDSAREELGAGPHACRPQSASGSGRRMRPVQGRLDAMRQALGKLNGRLS